MISSPKPPADLTLIEHLAELRRRLIWSLAAIALGCIVSWEWATDLLTVLLQPVLDVLPPGQGLIFTGLEDAFTITLKTSLWAGLMASSPFWLYQLWAFVAPALYLGEKKRVPALAFLAFLLMLAGAAFAYFLAFPMTFSFFIAFSTETLHPLLTLDRYCSLAMGLILAFALAFQLPLVLMFLGRLGLIDAAWLRRQRRYAILSAFIVGAVLTPPDVISQCILGGALMILYELSIWLISIESTRAGVL